MKMRMVRVQHRLCWLLACTVALFFCCMILKRHHHHPHHQDSEPPEENFFSNPSLLWVWSEMTSNLSAVTLTVNETFQNFTCFASDSKEVIPSTLPQAFQEFVRYRHCRTFPTLLTPSPCEDDLYLLLAIKSTAVQVERRAALRDTWGRAGLIRGQRVKLIFLMGRSVDEVQKNNPQPLLEWENHRYGDILQWDFLDRFYNLSRKEDRFLSWFSHMCSTAQFAFKGDDDVFVNTENLIELLSAHKPENHLFTGFIHQQTQPIRDRHSKYFIPVEMYPEGKSYPRFPSGGGYLMSRQTVLSLSEAAKSVKLFPLDDVFLGMCLLQAGINPIHHEGFMTFGLHQGLNRFDPCVYHNIMLMHSINPAELRVMWGLMQNNNLLCKK